MKNKTSIIFLIILISVLIFLLVMFLVLTLCGKKDILNMWRKSDKIIYDKTFSIEEIKNIQVKQGAGDVTVKESSNNDVTITAYGEENSDIQVSLNDDKLIVDNTKKSRFIFFSFGNINNDIIIYLPASYSNTLKIDTDMGNCYIENLPNATLNIDCDAGNVEIGKANNVNIKCDLGNVKAGEILNKCTVRIDSGNAEFEKLTLNENSKIQVDLGNIEIEETNDICIQANVDLGKTNISKNSRNSEIVLNLDCDCGNINVGK